MVVAPPSAPVRHVVHHRRVVHHRKAVVHHAAKKPVAQKAKPQTTSAADPGNQTELAAATPVNAVRTAAIAPLKAVHDSSTEGKLLLLAAVALLLVALASASVLRMLVRMNKAQQGW